MREISNVEINTLAKELDDVLKGARLQKFYELGEGEFRLEFHAPGKGTLDLMVELKKRINLTRYVKPAPQTPTQFAMQIRKHLEGALAENTRQYGFDRVLVIEFNAQDGKKQLIIEMFSNGNMILLGEEGRIIACYRTEEWSDRVIKRGVKYIFPASTKIDPREVDENKLRSILNEKKLIACLAGRINLGTIYLEEVIARAKLAVDKQANKLNSDEITELLRAFSEICKAFEHPVPTAYFKDGKSFDYSILPISKYASLESKQFRSISELLDEFYAPNSTMEEPKADKQFAEEKRKLEFALKTQREAAENLRKKAEEAKQAGDKIYEHYSELEALLRFVYSARKSNKSWDEIEKVIKGKAEIDRTKGRIIVNI